MKLTKILNFPNTGMMELEMIPRVDNMRMLAFYLKNCIEWVVAEQACFAYRLVKARNMFHCIIEQTLCRLITSKMTPTLV